MTSGIEKPLTNNQVQYYFSYWKYVAANNSIMVRSTKTDKI